MRPRVDPDREQPSETDEGWDVGGAQLERAFEQRYRPRVLAPVIVEVGEIVGPAWIVWRDRLGVTETGQRRGLVVGRHQNEAEIPMGATELIGGRLRAIDPRQCGVALADLVAHRLGQSGQIRKRDGPHLVGGLSFGVAGCRARPSIVPRGTRAHAGHEQSGQHDAGDRGQAHRPSPSVSHVYWSMGTSRHSSTRPLGHMTRTFGAVACSPRPTSTRGSFAEA